MSLALSTEADGSGPLVDLPVRSVTYGGKKRAGTTANVALAPHATGVTLTVTAVVPKTLEVGTKYYLVDKLATALKGVSKDASDVGTTTYEFLGSPGAAAPSVFGGPNPLYFKFMRDLLEKGGPAWPGGYGAVGTNADAMTFMKIAEGDRLASYLDSAGIPTIGVGINLNALSPAVEAKLAASVRSFFADPPASVTDDRGPRSRGRTSRPGTTVISDAKRDVYTTISAAYQFDPQEAPIALSAASDAQVVAMLRSWAAGKPPVGVKADKSTVTLAVGDKAISNADDAALFDLAFAEHRDKAEAELGTAAWLRINPGDQTPGNTTYSREAIAVNSFIYNVGSFRPSRGRGGWPSLRAALGEADGPDYTLAAFDLANAGRTTQAAGLTTRTEAEIEEFLFARTADVGEIIPM